MDAKRIIPMLQVSHGRVLEAPEGLPADWARRLELEGADEILFLAEDEAADVRAAWVRGVAGALFIPFAVSCSPSQDSAWAEVLTAGADQALVRVTPADLPQLAKAAQAHGRKRFRVAVALAWTPEWGWRAPMPQDPEGRDAMEWLVELGQMGAGEVVLAIGEEGASGLGALCQRAARLPMPVLLRTSSLDLGQEALLHGAEGLVYPIALGTPSEVKGLLGGTGLALRL